MTAASPSIISASRRTDIPAFYGDWFRNRRNAGRCEVRNPFSNQVYTVSLASNDIAGWVFWSRNYLPFLNTLMDLYREGHRFLCNFTINGSPRSIEPSTIPVPQAIETARRISSDFGKTCLSWRYDPVLLSSATPPEWHLENFRQIAAGLAGSVERCYFSFPCMYAKTRRNLDIVAGNHGFRVWSQSAGDFAQEDLARLARQLAEIAKKSGIQLYSCCDTRWLDTDIPVLPGRCVDWPLLRAMLPQDPGAEIKPHPSRKGCGCYRSVDIGRYDTCAHGCAYCYAVSNPAKATANWKQHDPNSPVL